MSVISVQRSDSEEARWASSSLIPEARGRVLEAKKELTSPSSSFYLLLAIRSSSGHLLSYTSYSFGLISLSLLGNQKQFVLHSRKNILNQKRLAEVRPGKGWI